MKSFLATLTLISCASLAAQESNPETVPTGELTLNQSMVRQGVAPKLSWNINYPTVISDVVTINRGKITATTPLRVTARVIGAAFDNGRYELPVKASIQVNGRYYQIFQGTGSQVNPARVLLTGEIQAGQSISFKANGSRNSRGSSWYSTRYASGNEVKLLKDGDTAPGLAGLRDQQDLEQYLRPYIKNGKLALGPMDLIYAAELYSTNPASSAYDLQDVVVLLRFEALDEVNNSYMNYVTQTQVGTDLEPLRLDDVDAAGGATAPAGVNGSAIFRLWTIHRTTGQEYLLDEKIVSSYHPQATIQVNTGDSYNGIARTRVDQRFTVNYNITGLTPNAKDAPTAAKSVVLQSAMTNYRSRETNANHSLIVQNGSKQFSRLTMIKASELGAGGEEKFTIYAHPDFGITESSMLAQSKVQIWPIAAASLKGIEINKPYTRLPHFTVELANLYPKSETYIRVYEGSPHPNPKNPYTVKESYTELEQAGVGNRKFILSGKKLGITQPGNYTVEIVHNTPFGSEVLTQLHPLQMKNGIRVVGSLSTSE